ncbi:hypothetical protein A4A49_20796 [Nicotiana attenuata]|uniref:Vacuolar fusion protein MON1 homolog n=1 Tax=Nicotiana attenuata TaxID=49451 RepID=A0A1J6IHI9_NICAT|nr:hypothetical protein A4A49_20796 [Nicotiana attenuata]
MSSDADLSDNDRKPKIGPSSNSIDQSLDAIENQLSSISVSQPESEPEFNDAIDISPSNQDKLANGSLSENPGAEELPRSNVVEDFSSSSVMWRNNSEEMEAPSSPSSSGYAGERGSSNASSRASGIEEEVDGEILEIGNSDSFDGVSDSQVQWLPGKRHGSEDDASISWRKRKKHFFVLSNSGKPIYSRNPASFLHAYTCLPLAYATRQAAGAILQDVADSGVLFAILMCKHKVISLVGAQKASLHPDDMLLLSNFVMSSESFRTSESFSPICLPRYNPMAFLHAYVQYLDVDTYLILLTTSSDAFYHLKDCRVRIEEVLLESNVLGEAQRSMVDGGMRVEDLPTDHGSQAGAVSPHLGQPGHNRESSDRFSEAFIGVGGPAGLWHFMYRSIYLDQYVSSEFSSPVNNRQQQKRLYRAYQKLYASMHDKGVGPHKTQFRRDENYVLLCWVTQDFELYAAFDPLADKALAIKTCNRVCQWIKNIENEIFLLGASPFSW